VVHGKTYRTKSYEGKVSRVIVQYLLKNGYNVTKDNSDRPTQRGVDIVAEKNSAIELIEVKGYPSEYYTRGLNRGKKKVTKPKLQAKHWLSEALVTCMFNYCKYIDKTTLLAIGILKFDRYVQLLESISPYFKANKLRVKIYLVGQKGEITIMSLSDWTWSTSIPSR
jgi:Holliday junction resolvase-like predicted endonuclease